MENLIARRYGEGKMKTEEPSMLMQIDGKKFKVIGTWLSRGQTTSLYFPEDQDGPRNRTVEYDGDGLAHFVPGLSLSKSAGQAVPTH